MFRVMVPASHAGGIPGYVRFGRTFKSLEAALHLAAGLSGACCINDKNECVAHVVQAKKKEYLFNADGHKFEVVSGLGKYKLVKRVD